MCTDNKNLTKENLRNALAGFLEKEKLEVKDVAKALGCPMSVLGRIVCGVTWPSDEMLKRCHTLFEIGFSNYRKLSEADKEKISDAFGAVGGAGIGVGASISTISALGTVAGLSGAGITSGLAALGAFVGGGMVAGLALAAAIPLAAAAGGYLLINGIKSGIAETELRAEKFESRWERPVEEVIPKDAV